MDTEINSQQYWYAFVCVTASIDEIVWGSLRHLKYTRVSAHARWLAQERFRGNELEDNILLNRIEEACMITELLKEQVQLEAAQQMYLQVLAGYEKALGVDHTSTINTVNNLGNLYADQGKLVEAEQMYRRALAGRKKELGVENTSMLDTVNNLGNLYYNQGELAKAEQMYRRALAG